MVAQSIRDYGFNQPLVLDADHVIVAGHTRYRALRKLGWTQAPCIVTALSAEEAKAYRIADNKTGEVAQWDLSKLIPELREITDIATMSPYFPEYDLSVLLEQTSGDTMPPVTNEDVSARTESYAGLFPQRSAERVTGLVDVSCPHCGQSFSVSRADIEKGNARPE